MKNVLFLCLVFILISVCTTLYSQAPPVQPGDVNEDNEVDIIDALLIAQYYVGITPPGLINTSVSDVNYSGRTDIVDALLIAQLYVGIIQTFPDSRTPVPTPPPGPPDSSREVPNLEEFSMSYGETVRLSGFDFLITVSDVTDSRCPDGVVCVWEGEAIVILDCWTSTEYLGILELKAPPAEPQFGTVIDTVISTYYRITCIAVDPYPVADNPTPIEDYVVTLECDAYMAMP